METMYPRSHKRRSRRSAKSELLYRLSQLLRENNHRHSRRAKGCSGDTAMSRAQILRQGFIVLNELGFKLRDPAGFGNRHMLALARHWEEQRLSASEIQRRFSVFRFFVTWIGKDGMVEPAGKYLLNPACAIRSYVASKPKGWSGLVTDIEDKLAEVAKLDKLVALQLALQWVFALRVPNKMKNPTYTQWHLHPSQGGKGCHDRWSMTDCGN